jgi:hypothetical protein
MGVWREMDGRAEFFDLCHGFEDLQRGTGQHEVLTSVTGDGRTVTSACSRSAAPHARPQIPAPTMMILSLSWGVGIAIVVFGSVSGKSEEMLGELIT